MGKRLAEASCAPSFFFLLKNALSAEAFRSLSRRWRQQRGACCSGLSSVAALGFIFRICAHFEHSGRLAPREFVSPFSRGVRTGFTAQSADRQQVGASPSSAEARSIKRHAPPVMLLSSAGGKQQQPNQSLPNGYLTEAHTSQNALLALLRS
jgi:hypothetical protein